MRLLVWVALAGLMWYPPQLTVIPQAGSTVSDVVEIRVTASEPLKRVEFLLDGAPVGSDTSTPYTWTWDTLSVEEGEHTLTLRAIDMNDRAASTEVRYVVDNGLSRGGQFYLESARQQIASQRWSEAVKSARRAVRLLPEDGQAHYLLAQAWLEVSEWAKAVESAQRAVDLSPSPETLGVLAEAQVRVAFSLPTDEERRFSSLQSAVESALRAGELRLSSAKTPVEKARALASLGRLEEAATAYLQAGNTPQNHLSSARCYLLAGRWQDADRMCNLAERQSADKTTVAVYRALVLAVRARTNDSRTMLERLEENEQTRLLVALARADVALREKKAPEALRLLVSLPQEGSGALDTLLMTGFAEAREFPRAEDHFRNALVRNPLNWQALAQKGYESLAVGSIVNAYRYFNLAARIRPDDAWVLCGLALCEQNKGRAVELAQRAVKQAPSDPWAFVVLSSVQWRAGQTEEAMRTIKRAYEMDRDNYNIGAPPDVRRAGQIARIFGRRPALPLD